MLRVVFIFFGALLLGSSARAESSDWIPIARQCAAEVERQAGCTTACVNRTWRAVALCTNAQLKPPFPQKKFEQCLNNVQWYRTEKKLCELCGDPVRDAFKCVARE